MCGFAFNRFRNLDTAHVRRVEIEKDQQAAVRANRRRPTGTLARQSQFEKAQSCCSLAVRRMFLSIDRACPSHAERGEQKADCVSRDCAMRTST